MRHKGYFQNKCQACLVIIIIIAADIDCLEKGYGNFSTRYIAVIFHWQVS